MSSKTTLLAVLIYFFRQWRDILLGSLKPENHKSRVTLRNLVIATIPAALVGYFAEPLIEHALREPLIAAINLVLFAIILWFVDTMCRQKESIETLSWSGALIVGLFQCFALIPGVSRSGITITGARALGLNREQSTQFSFLLLAPITFGAVLSELPSIVSIPDWQSVVIGIMTSFIIGMAAIHIMLKLVKNFGFIPYIAYRIVVGLAFIIWILN